jgi:hypothetical protein
MRRTRLLLAFVLGTLPALAQVPETRIQGTGEFDTLFVRLKTRLLQPEEGGKVKLGGKDRTQFVPWIRDHVHVMKAMQYFSPDLSSFWEFFMQHQTPEGLYYDYYYPITDRVNSRLNLFDRRYWKVLPAEALQMHRLPVEADLEYLLVEGAQYIFQATGDTAYLRPWVPRLEKGLRYAMTDPLRWSRKHQLVKRGYTLDTWDFMQLPTTREEYRRQGKDIQKGIFDIDSTTPMGIMHGDNSGMFAACGQLSRLYAALGNGEKAAEWTKQAEGFRQRTNALCWNGRFYAHFVEDDPVPPYLTMDQRHTLSLSNPYDINRGLPTPEMARSIIAAYRGLKGNNQLNAFAEWFGVYPPVEPHFADYLPGSYMNGGVNTIVGGELAKAALQNGEETYGVDILRRINALTDRHNGDLPVAYKPDGTVDAGIPDNWGQAAVLNALVEGLAGVLDRGVLFQHVELSPRWLAAGQNRADVTIAYGPSGKHVRYTFDHDARAKRLTLNLSGDPQRYTVRLLLPPGRALRQARVDGKPVPARTEQVGTSRYAVLDEVPAGERRVEVGYR